MAHKTFLINLDKSTTRLADCQQVLARLAAPFERIAAVYGPNLSATEQANAYSDKGKHTYYKRLVPGEIGCYMSHRKAWQKIVDEKLDFAVILEDDIDAQELDYAQMIAAIKSIERPWYYLKLAGHLQPKHIVRQHALEGFSLVSFRKVPTRTNAQAVSFEGAKRLLAHSSPFGRPVDVDLQHWWEKEIHIDGLLPFPFGSNETVTSEIHTSTSSRQVETRRLKQFIDRISYYWNYHMYGRVLARNLERK